MSEIVVESEPLVHPGNLWREEISRRGLRQVDVCDAVGVSSKHLSQILNGRVLPSVELVIALADYLDVSVRTMWNVQSRWVLESALGERAARE